MSDPALFDAEYLRVPRRCDVCGQALIVQHDHLYVIQRQVWIKIGATNNLTRRTGELSRPTGRQHILYPRGMDWYAPLSRLALLNGGGKIEHQLHQRFAEFHVIGEWFQDTLSIRRWLREVT